MVMQQLDLLYDISDGTEAVPVLCDNIEAKKYFVYAASCPETHARDEDAADSQEDCGCSCSNGCSDVDDCACKLLLPGTSVNMRECGSACACSANRRCQISPVFNGLTCRLVIRSSGAKGLGKRTLFVFETHAHLPPPPPPPPLLRHVIMQACLLWKIYKMASLFASTPGSEYVSRMPWTEQRENTLQ
jgi:hypothetical protein